MGKYDNVDRDYFSVKDRFAELISVGIYHKKLTVKELDWKKVMEEKKDMCKAYRELIKDWKQEGIIQGVEVTFACIEKVKAGFSKSASYKMDFRKRSSIVH